MHLIETYSLACGLKVNSPFLYEMYFPIPFEKYILFHAGGKQPAKLYDYYSEVVSMVRDVIREHGYELLQIGSTSDSQIMNVIDLRGKTTFHHTAYLIHRAALMVGNDSCNVHIGSGFNVPLISLYGSTRASNHGPYFGDKSKQIILESGRKGCQPTFSTNESPKTINDISPEKVAQGIFDLLKIDKQINIETIYIGPQYINFVIEFIPDSVIKPDFFPGAVFNVRMDYHFDEQALQQNLAVRQLCIITDQAININILKRFKNNVALVIYDIDKEGSVDFVNSMLEAAIPYHLISALEGDKLDTMKLKFFDYGIILKKEKQTEKSLENFEKITKLSRYKTRKFLLSDNKIYLTKGDWLNKKPTPDFTQNIGTVPTDDPTFWESKDFLYIYSEKKYNET